MISLNKTFIFEYTFGTKRYSDPKTVLEENYITSANYSLPNDLAYMNF